MARNRQRAKERQARRKAEQADASGDGQDALKSTPPEPEPEAARPEPVEPEAVEPEAVEPEPAEPEPDPEPDEPPPLTPEEIALRAGAPPQELGRSDEVIEDDPDLDDLDEDYEYDPDEDDAEEEVAPTTRGPRGKRGEAKAQHKNRPRFVQFLFAVVAELRRVQWPDRQATTTLTGVVLGFVLIAGGYLGLLDAIFSRIIKAIL